MGNAAFKKKSRSANWGKGRNLRILLPLKEFGKSYISEFLWYKPFIWVANELQSLSFPTWIILVIILLQVWANVLLQCGECLMCNPWKHWSASWLLVIGRQKSFTKLDQVLVTEKHLGKCTMHSNISYFCNFFMMSGESNGETTRLMVVQGH